MPDIKLTQPVVEVVTEAAAGELTATTVQTDNRDAIAWDLSRGRRNYPTAQEAPILWLTFLAYNALRRSGHPVGKFDEFLQTAVSVRAIREDGEPVTEEDEYTVGPTSRAAEPV